MKKHWLEFCGEPTDLQAGDKMRIDVKCGRVSFARPRKGRRDEPLLMRNEMLWSKFLPLGLNPRTAGNRQRHRETNSHN